MPKKIIVVIVFCLLIASDVFFIWRYLDLRWQRSIPTQSVATSNRQQVADFGLSFVKDVLRAKNEVDFETRLKLENMVRALNQPAILAVWQKFVTSETEIDAQDEAKNLLELLFKNVR